MFLGSARSVATQTNRMKLLIVCALLPVALCLPNKLHAFFNEDKLKGDVAFLMQQFVGGDLARQACEAECNKYVTDDKDKEINFSLECPLACSGVQEALKKLISHPVHSKRAVNITSLIEAKCEHECHPFLQTGHELNFGCPLVCHSFHTLNTKRDPATAITPPTVSVSTTMMP